MIRRGRYESIGVASSSPGKFEMTKSVADELGIVGLVWSWLEIEQGLAEPVKRNPKDVGIEKMVMFVPNINAALSKLSIVPQSVAIMDVLAVVQNLPKLTEEESVMKKPESMTALEAFTTFFALCRDQMVDGGENGEPIEILEIAYYLINATAPVDHTKKKLDLERRNAIEVGYERVDFFLNKALVDLLADPGEIRKLALEAYPIGEVLTTSSIVGFRIQDLIPLIVEVASKKRADGVQMEVRGDKDRGGWQVQIDGLCDLEQDIEVGVDEGGGNQMKVPFMKYIKWAVKNVTPWLVNKMYVENRKKKRKVAK